MREHLIRWTRLELSDRDAEILTQMLNEKPAEREPGGPNDRQTASGADGRLLRRSRIDREGKLIG